MNKLGIRIYKEKILYIDDLYYSINSIIYDNFEDKKFRMRYIDTHLYGICLNIENK